MSKAKRHHYLPRFYLDGFCRDGGLWVYDKDSQESRPQTPVNTGVKQYYYRFEYEDGQKGSEVEEFLSEVESNTAPVIEKLRREEEIDDEQRAHLAFFLGTLLGRTPSAERKHNQTMDALLRDQQKRRFPTPESLREFFHEHEDLGDKVGDDIDFDALCDFIQGNEYDIVSHRNESIKAMFLLADDVAPAYFKMDWHVLRPRNRKKKSFVTSDTPIVHTFEKPPPFKVRKAHELPEGIQVIAPLAQDCLLVMEDEIGPPGFDTLDGDSVRGFNLAIAAAADRFIVGRDQALVESVARIASKKRKLLVSREFEEALGLAVEAAREAAPSDEDGNG